MDRRLALLASAATISLLVAVPISLLLAGLLLPGDPDDPNLKAFALAVAATLPFGLAAAGTYWLAVHFVGADGQARPRLASLLKAAIPVSVAGLLLVLAWKVAYATPAPETTTQAAGSPYLWRDGAFRMAGCALVLVTASAIIAIPNVQRTRTRTPLLPVEDQP